MILNHTEAWGVKEIFALLAYPLFYIQHYRLRTVLCLCGEYGGASLFNGTAVKIRLSALGIV
jgi:hypothetical protein